MPEVSASQWEAFLRRYPNAHLLQSAAWGDLKASFGWKTRRVVVGDAGAQVLVRPLALGFSLAYIPKGPVGPDWSGLWPELDRLCRRERAILLKAEPDVWTFAEGVSPGSPPEGLNLPGFALSPHSIQPRRTLVVDLRPDEETLLNRMKSKTRYNIRLAQKKDVSVRPSPDVDCFFQLMQATGERDGFGVHSLEYYRRAYTLFAQTQAVQLFLAEYQDKPLAALMVFRWGERAWYFYGASNDLERSRMPAYLLQWEAMRWARRQGCSEYDLWGVPDADEAALEAQFDRRSDGLWGVYRFKRGFGGRLVRSAGAWDKVYNPPLAALYRWAVNRNAAD